MNEMLAWSIVGGFIVKELVSLVLKHFFNRANDQVKALDENTKAIIKLEAKLEFFHQAVAEIPKMQKDINEAHTKIREMKARCQEVSE